MSSKIKKEYLLKNLDCANCAAKIEREVGLVTGVESSALNFINKKLIIEFINPDDDERVSKEIYRIVKKFEPEVDVIELVDNNRELKEAEQYTIINEDNRSDAIKLIVGLLLLGLGVGFKFDKYIEFALFFISYMVVGGEILLNAFRNIRSGEIFDENFLMSIATIGAFAIGQFPEGVSVMIFFQIGEFLQDIAVRNSRKSITALMNIKPDYANLVIDKVVQRVSPEKVNIGDYIIIKPGERVPLDGVVTEGNSTIDTSALTGEAIPRGIKVGDGILSGCININGLLKIKVSKEFSESTVSKILDLVQNASSRKAPTENFITKFARYYTPVVVVVAVILAIIPPFFLSGATFSEWIYKALIFLVVSCPCALVISIPLSFFGGIGSASRHGILIKGSNYLEALNKVNIVVFDKTGTLTKGKFKVTKINTISGNSKEELLEVAAYAESYSNHPIAISILNAYGEKIDRDKIKQIEEIPGHGIKAKIKGRDIYIGNSKFMEKEDIPHESVIEGGTVIHVAIDKMYIGNIIIADELKESSKETISGLKKSGIQKVVMLTGDNKQIGEAVAKKLSIDEVYSELLPADKVDKLELLKMAQQKGEKLAFVGDGINDAPVIAMADIGIAMGGLGADAAIEAADIVIMEDDPIKLITAIKIAKKTQSIVWQNIIFALGVKLIVQTLGVLGIATMWEAVFADVGVALIAVLNSMRAMKVKQK